MNRNDDAGPDGFGYGYFDHPTGPGYRGYHRESNGDGPYLPWRAAREFCAEHHLASAIDVGCAKGFLVAELLDAGIDATGYDVSRYALSFATDLPCYRADVRKGIPGHADAVFALGTLVYVDENELSRTLGYLRQASDKFLLVSNYYQGDSQDVPDPFRRITRPYGWWRSKITNAGFSFDCRERFFDVYTV